MAGTAAVALALLFLLAAIGPRTGLYATFTVESGSMAPAIPVGSLVVVRPVPPVSLRVGDIVTYTSSQPPYPTVTHRVLSIGQTPMGLTFTTKGDANLTADPWEVRYARSAGKVVLTLPGAGYAFAAISNHVAQLGLGVLVLLMAAIWWLRLVWRRSGPIEKHPGLAAPSFPPVALAISNEHLPGQSKISPWRVVVVVCALVVCAQPAGRRLTPVASSLTHRSRA